METLVRYPITTIWHKHSSYLNTVDGESVGSVPAAQLKEFCATGDGVCELHTFDITAAHLSYTTNGDCPAGATFIEGIVKADGTSTASADSSATSAAVSATSSASSLGSLLSGLEGSSASTTAAGSAATGLSLSSIL